MARLGVILIVIAVAFTIFTLVDVILTEKWRVRGVPKPVWLIIVLLLPPIGAILWFVIGKGKRDQARSVVRGAPDDDPAFLNNLRRDEESDERIRQLEQQLSELDDDPPKE
jgi:Phospholipase_D-nuclease N-terminal